jgi:ribosomal protein S6
MSTRDYEAMFILDHNAASADFDATAGVVDEILQKHGATLVQKEKWDERKLAYEIKGHRRGTYYLTYFTAPAQAIDRINEDVRLSEPILRHLVVALDRPIDTHIAETAADRERMAEDNRKNSLGGWGGRRGDSRRGSGRRREGSSEDRGGDGEGRGKTRERPAEAEAKGSPAKPAQGETSGSEPSESKAAEPEHATE